MSPTDEARCLAGRLSDSLLRVVDDLEKVDWLREVLSGFSHKCRNSLNGMKLGFYLCKRESSGSLPPYWSDLEQTYDLIETTIDRLQLIYRPMKPTMVESGLEPMIAEHESSWRTSFARLGKILSLHRPPSDRPGKFDPMLLGQGLDAFISWRAESSPAATRANLTWSCLEGEFLVKWTETAPPHAVSLQPGNEAGATGVAPHFEHGIDPLALPLLARIVRAHDGKVSSTQGPTLSLSVTWPRVPTCVT